MTSQRHTIIILLVLILVLTFLQKTHGKSVYVINNTETSQIQVYKINGTNLVYQTDYFCELDPLGETGAVGLAIDESEYGEFLFVTFEGTGKIEIVNAKTMNYVDFVTTTGASNLAGIVLEKIIGKVYTVDRGTDHLFSYTWDPVTKTLIADYNDPYYIQLEGISQEPGEGAYGLAFDYENGRLYVADNTTTVKCYDANDPNWSKLDEFTFTVTDKAIGIAIDIANQYVYTGNGPFEKKTYLSRYDLTEESETTVDVNSPVLGIAVDQDTGLIYLTTYGYGDYDTQDRLIIYDSNLVKQSWESGDIGNPADVAVGSTAAYKPPFPLVELVKDDNDIDCASPLISEEEHELLGTPYNWLYYNIDCNANGYADTNVFITDYLPVEVDYNSSDPCGLYDPNTHTVTWYIPVMSASYSNTFRIQVGVNYHAKPGHTITNYCEIESDQYCTFTTWTTDICCYGGNIIYVNQDANDPNSYHNGTSWLDAYTDLQDALLTARTCGFNQIWVAEGTYIPIETYSSDISARAISFELIDGVSIYGGFPSGGGQWANRDPNAYNTILSGDIGTPVDQNDNSYHVVKCVDVNNATLDGFTITDGHANPHRFGYPSSKTSYALVNSS